MAGKTSFAEPQHHTNTVPAVAGDVIDLEAAIVTPAEQLEQMTNGLTAFQQFFLRRRIGKLRMEEATRLAAAIGEAVVVSTVYKLTVALDVDKKRTFVAYMKASGELQRELQHLEAEFRNALALELLRIDELASRYKKIANDQVETMQAAELLSEAEAGKRRARYLKVAQELEEDNLISFQQLMGNFKELLIRTLSVFRSELRDAKLI